MLLISDHHTNAGPRCPLSLLGITSQYAGVRCPAGCRDSRLHPLINAADARAITGQSRQTWEAAVRYGSAPAAAWRDDSGHPWWLPGDVERYRDNRPGPGRRSVFKAERTTT